MFEEYGYDENMAAYSVTPELAHMLESMSLEQLLDLFDAEHLIIARFIEGRERRELDPPTEEEIAFVHEWFAKVQIDISLLKMVLQGLIYVDRAEDGEMVFEASFKGRKIVDDMTPEE